MRQRIEGHGTRHHVMPQKNYCFGCGKDNPEGLRLKFHFDEERRVATCRFRLSRRFWGPPRHAHGGIIATILDEAMGKVNKLRHVVAVTSTMEVRYHRMVPLGEPLVVEGWERRVRGREHINVAEIRNQAGEVLASSKGKFIAVDPVRMFARFLREQEKK
ncbi:MAG TPA: PaaI family thioesterase [Terriglobales bacterium]|nr:PaaI family thioesterase [Terriglobales bacterium]